LAPKKLGREEVVNFSIKIRFCGRTAHLGAPTLSGSDFGINGTLFLFIHGLLADQGKFP